MLHSETQLPCQEGERQWADLLRRLQPVQHCGASPRGQHRHTPRGNASGLSNTHIHTQAHSCTQRTGTAQSRATAKSARTSGSYSLGSRAVLRGLYWVQQQKRAWKPRSHIWLFSEIIYAGKSVDQLIHESKCLRQDDAVQKTAYHKTCGHTRLEIQEFTQQYRN